MLDSGVSGYKFFQEAFPEPKFGQELPSQIPTAGYVFNNLSQDSWSYPLDRAP